MYDFNDIWKHNNEFGQYSFKKSFKSHEQIRIIGIFPIDKKKDAVIFLIPKIRHSRNNTM